MSKKKRTVGLECTSAFMAAGDMITPGQEVHGVPVDDADNLVRRGKAKLLATEPEAGDADATPLKDMTVDELKAEAKEHEIDGADKMKEAELIAAIEAVEGEGGE